jgi:hypothetical protein
MAINTTHQTAMAAARTRFSKRSFMGVSFRCSAASPLYYPRMDKLSRSALD